MTNRRLRLIFMGTPEFSVSALQALIDAHDVIAVYTREPKPKGRGHHLQKSPVHELAERHRIPVFTPKSFKKDPDVILAFQALGADVAVVAAYGLILPLSVLNAPRLGCLNIHASLLPRWRGASPIQHAILAGDEVSGVTIMQMEEGLDTGPMLLKHELDIAGMTTPRLHDALAAMGAEMIVNILASPAQAGALEIPACAGKAKLWDGETQVDTESTYAPMLKKEDGLIDWTKPAAYIDAQVRALNPWPGTYATINGRRLKILKGTVTDGGPGPGKILCGDGLVYRIETLQPENAKPMDVQSAVNGTYL